MLKGVGSPRGPPHRWHVIACSRMAVATSSAPRPSPEVPVAASMSWSARWGSLHFVQYTRMSLKRST